MEEAPFAPDADLFQPVPKPGPHDWMAGPGRDERHRTFEQYLRSKPIRPTAERRTIVLQPLGKFTRSEKELLEKVKTYSSIFFGVETRAEQPRAMPERGMRVRKEAGKRWKQYLTGAVMDRVLRRHLPDDAVCCLGITMEDLYPDPKWNFVFGQASLRDRVGVYSFARYNPAFYGERADKDTPKLMLLRSVKVTVHETGHMFGLRHCRRHQCVMNGSNHLAESDSRPVFLCPDCLRKLHWNLKFDIIARYEKMEKVWREQSFEKESRWLAKRIRKLKQAAGSTDAKE